MAKNPPEVLTTEEADAILRQPNRATLTGLRNRCILEVAYRAGLRVSEIVNLRPQDVRLGVGRLEVRNSKGGKGRNIPLRQSTVELLESWTAIRPDGDRYFSTCFTRHGIAAGNPVGSPLSKQYVEAMLHRYVKRAGIERRVTPHMFRHTYATELLSRGFTIREVQALLGHSHVNTTMIYLHVNHGDVAARIAELK